MPRYSPSQIRSKIRRAQQQIDQARRKLERELRNPVIEIQCSCGYRSKTRRSINSLPRQCPNCGGPICYLTMQRDE